MYSSNAPLSSWFRILMMLLFLCRSIWFAPVCSVLLCAGPCFKSLHSGKSIWREVNSLKALKLPVHRAQGMRWDVARRAKRLCRQLALSGHARLVKRSDIFLRHWGQLARQVWVCVASSAGVMEDPKKSLLMGIAKQPSKALLISTSNL